MYRAIDRFFFFVWSLSHSDRTNLVGETSENTKVIIGEGGSMHCSHSHVPHAHASVKSCLPHLIIINVTHIWMFRNYSFNFGRNIAKRGRNMERHRECNIAEPKFELKSFRSSSCVFYGRGHI